MDSRDIEKYFRQHRRMLAVIFVMIGMLSVSGFFMGMLQTERHATRRSGTIPQPDPVYVAAEAQATELPAAPKYGEIPV